MCVFTSPSGKAGKNGLFFFHDLPPSLSYQKLQGLQSLDRAPNGAIHKVQQNQDKTLPAAQHEPRRGLKCWGGRRWTGCPCGSCPLWDAETFPAVSFIICGNTSASTGNPVSNPWVHQIDKKKKCSRWSSWFWVGCKKSKRGNVDCKWQYTFKKLGIRTINGLIKPVKEERGHTDQSDRTVENVLHLMSWIKKKNHLFRRRKRIHQV